MKTAVLFDADGVVIQSEPFTIQLEKQLGIPQSALSDFFETRFPDCLLGNADLTEELDSLLPEIGWKE